MNTSDFSKYSLGEKIRYYRKNKNLTQGEVAAKIGISRVMISKYESGSTIPSLDMIVAISDALEVKISDFLGSREKEFLNTEDEKIISKYLVDNSLYNKFIEFNNDQNRKSKAILEIFSEDEWLQLIKSICKSLSNHDKYMVAQYASILSELSYYKMEYDDFEETDD